MITRLFVLNYTYLLQTPIRNYQAFHHTPPGSSGFSPPPKKQQLCNIGTGIVVVCRCVRFEGLMKQLQLFSFIFSVVGERSISTTESVNIQHTLNPAVVQDNMAAVVQGNTVVLQELLQVIRALKHSLNL